MKKLYSLLVLSFSVFCASGQVVNIPDAAFKARLLEASTANQIASSNSAYFVPMKIDANNNGEIEEEEALLVRMLHVDNATIASLEGISSFPNLRELYCNNNSLTSLDVNNLTFLRRFNCSYNSLTSLNCQDITNRMEYFDCSYNNLTSLALPNFFEFLDQGDQSIYANCSHNQLAAIVFSANEELSHLDLSYNNFTSLAFGHLEVYGYLSLSNNPLTNINFDNVYLGAQGPDEDPYLGIDNTNLTELYVPFRIKGGSSISNNPNLVHLNLKNSYVNFDSYYETDETGEENRRALFIPELPF
ncbi:MAG: hypothetical protein QM710_14040 [Flavobacterium sp.]